MLGTHSKLVKTHTIPSKPNMMKALAAIIVTIAVTTVVASGATSYTGNGGTGFGAPIGLGSLSLSDNGTVVTGTLTKGTGGFNDAFVIYLDTTAGGLTDTSTYTDSADYLRRAISGFNGAQRATLTFPSGFAPDYAIALAPSSNANFGGLWSLSNTSNFGFLSSVNLTPNNSTSNATYTFSFNLSDIGVTSGNSFKFVTTYLDANGAYRSNESISTALAGVINDPNGNFGQNPVTALNFSTYPGALPIPEPGTVSLVAGSLLLWGCARLRRS